MPVSPAWSVAPYTLQLSAFFLPVVRFIIPVVFYEIANVECVYWSDTAIFIGRI